MSNRPRPTVSRPLGPSRTSKVLFNIWFAFCAVLGVAVIGLMIWGGISLISYLNRH